MRLSILAFAALSLSAAPSPSGEIRFTITDLGTLPGGNASEGWDINDVGQVTGWSESSNGSRAFLYDGTTMHDLGTLDGASTSIGYGINDAGHVTGESGHAFLHDGTTMHDIGSLGVASTGCRINNADHVTGWFVIDFINHYYHAFLHDGTTTHDLGTLGGSYSRGYDINDAGHVAGISTNDDGDCHAILYDGTTMHDLGTLGGPHSYGIGINNAGCVTGMADTGDGARDAFIYDGIAMHDLGTLGGPLSQGRGINDAGHVTGMSLDGEGDFRPFFYDGTTMHDLTQLIDNGSGWTDLQVYSINNSDQITGFGTIGGQQHAFLLTAVSDEPSVCAFCFYNNSAWDEGDGSANAADDNAIASDKTVLLPGQTATFANYTSYDKGINGLMIDVCGLPGTPTLNDFLFRQGNDNEPYGSDVDNPADDWPWAPDPIAFAVRPGAGQDGADRVALIWDDGVIRNCWLQVTVLATDATGLAANKVFYVGNAVGETGNSITDALVNATDEIGARSNPHSPFNPAAKDDPYDFNRDTLVNATDQIIARANRTSPFTALKLIAPPWEPVSEGE